MITILKQYLLKSKPRWILYRVRYRRMSMNIRTDFVHEGTRFKEVYTCWAFTSLPKWILWLWLPLVFYFHRLSETRSVSNANDYIIHIDSANWSQFELHSRENNLRVLLEQSLGIVLVETVIEYNRVYPLEIRLHFTRASDLIMLKLSTDLKLETLDVI